MIADTITERLGDCVLIPVPKGEKGPKIKAWQKLTLSDMTAEHYAKLDGQNIGVLLGSASNHLISIDADSDDFLELFLSVNPSLRESFISRASRGGNVWLRLVGDYPRSGKIKNADSSSWGEFRADGLQTVVYGQHPSGCNYTNNRKQPLSVEFASIVWPEGLILPWGLSLVSQPELQVIPKLSGNEVSTGNDENDAGRAAIFCHRFMDEIRYVPERDYWLCWEGRWIRDADHGLQRRAIKLANEQMVRVAVNSSNNNSELEQQFKALKKSLLWGNKRIIQPMLELAKAHSEIQVSVNKLDADPYLLGARNAVIDLRTGIAREHAPSDLVTKFCNADFDETAIAPRWIQFLEEVFPDPEVRHFAWKAAGYSISGDMGEEVFFFLYNSGRNGKSKFIGAIYEVLGNYAETGGQNLFITNAQGSDPKNEKAKIVGSRFLRGPETEGKQKLNMRVIKDITGGDSLDAEAKYEHPFTFKPVCKLWIVGNHKPVITDTGAAIWDRVRLIPFERYFEPHERDPDLEQKLRAETSGILNWLIQGCLLWQKEGLNAPEKLKNAVAEYRREEDTLADFIEQSTEKDAFSELPQPQLFKVYEDWVAENGIRYPHTSPSLAKALRDRGWESKRSNKERNLWQGVRILN